MNILILNGSPKGANSITLQTCLYIQKHYGQHQYRVLHVGQKIGQLEQDFTPAAEALAWAEMVLFCYPVYTFLVPAQLHRFVELMKGRQLSGELQLWGKWATQITTSKHFYDLTAHRFIEENAKDMGLRVLPGLSADMEDLLSARGRREALQFFDYVLFLVAPTPLQAIDNKVVAVVVDTTAGDAELERMVERFRQQMPCQTKVFDIGRYPFKGGCLSCFHCSADGKCIYSDGFDSFLRQQVQVCDAIVYGFAIRDHSMGSRFKMYDDRQFCNGHRTVTMGAPTGYLVSGDYGDESNLQMVVEARANVGGNYLCGVATSSGAEDAEHRTMGVEQLVQRLAYALARQYRQPANFFGVGGMRIFRDLIYMMRGLMRADHKFFKSHGQYDFPQKQWKQSMLMYVVGWMMHSRKLKSRLGSKMTEGMLRPYKKALEE